MYKYAESHCTCEDGYCNDLKSLKPQALTFLTPKHFLIAYMLEDNFNIRKLQTNLYHTCDFLVSYHLNTNDK